MRTYKHLAKLASTALDYANWYDIANRDIHIASNRLGFNPDRFADIIAITSPRISVRKNIRRAITYMQTGILGSDLIRSTHAAIDHYEQTGCIRGAKTYPFSLALKGNKYAIVLDVWMSVAFEINQRRFDNKSVHKECCRRIKQTAKLLNMKPAATQACIWCAIVREHHRTIPQFTIQDELTLFDH